MTPEILTKAEQLVTLAKAKGKMVAVAESCTGGLVAAAITSISGSSEIFERGFVTYANMAKHQMLGVPLDMLQACGAVSKEVAIAMAEGVLNHSYAHISVAITGIAGPTGGTVEKPVGLVHIASRYAKMPVVHKVFHFSGNREEIRNDAVSAALDMLLEQLG